MKICGRRINSNLLLLMLCLLLLTSTVFSKTTSMEVNHKVRIENIGEQIFNIETTIKNINSDELKIMFPMYRPGIYTTYFYIKNIGSISITDQNGDKLSYRMTKKNTFLIDTKGINEVNVKFHYRGIKLSSNEAYLDNDVGFFTGVQFFVLINDEKTLPSDLEVIVPEGWETLSTLEKSGKTNSYKAENYDELADSQTMVGKFDLSSFKIDGKTHYLATSPKGFYSEENTKLLKEKIKGIVDVQTNIFKETPYDKFIYFYVFKFIRGTNTANTSEYLSEIQSSNSHLHIVEPTEKDSDPMSLIASIIHNHFHAWSLMRMRPVENWEWDYSQNVDSRMLWLTEGITRYYMTITRLRTKNGDVGNFMFRVNESINGVELHSSRNMFSPADASILSGVRFEGILEADYSFVRGGHIIGVLLDLSIRQETNNKYSLDDVMRLLYQETYKKGRGYTTDDFKKIIERLTKRSYTEFFDKYVEGTEIPPYDTYLGYAGYRLQKNVSQRPLLGVILLPTDKGVFIDRVNKDGLADKSGLMREDVILKFGDLDVVKNGLAGAGKVVRDNIGKSIPLKIKRNDKEVDIQLMIENVSGHSFRVVPVESPTSEQLKLRSEWLKQ